MGWTAYYQLRRDRPLDDAELAALDGFVAQHNRTPWEGERFALRVTRAARADRVVAVGEQKLPGSPDASPDPQRLCNVLTSVQHAIDGLEVRVRDDLDLFGWNPVLRVISLAHPQGPDLAEVPAAELGEFVAPGLLRAPAGAPLSRDAAGFLAGKPPSRKVLRALLREHAAMPSEHPARAELDARLRGSPPLALVLAGFEAGADVEFHTWYLIAPAMAAVVAAGEVAAIVPGFLALWAKHRGMFASGTVPLDDAILDALARVPEVEARMLADVAAGVAGSPKEVVHRRAGHAAIMLGRAGGPAARAAVIDGLRALRRAAPSLPQQHHTHGGLLEAMVRLARPDAAPTLLRELIGAGGLSHARRDAIHWLARTAPARLADVMVVVGGTREVMAEVATALDEAATPAGRDGAARVRARGTMGVRTDALDALRKELGGEERAVLDGLRAPP